MQYGSFAEQVSAAGITKKLLQKEGKRMIRLLAIQTGTPMRVRQLLPSVQRAQHPLDACLKSPLQILHQHILYPLSLADIFCHSFSPNVYTATCRTLIHSK